MRAKIVMILVLVFLATHSAGCVRRKKNFIEKIPTVPNIVLSSYFQLQGSLATDDCGPVAEFQALRYMGYSFTMQEIIDGMGWHRNIPNITDTILQHKALLINKSVNHKIKLSSNLNELVERIYANTPVVVLLRFSPTKYHWVVLTGFVDNRAYMSWGDGRLVSVTLDEFLGWFTGNAIMYFR